MKREMLDKWTTALRSGEYKQVQSVLEAEGGYGYCCLGVLCLVTLGDARGYTTDGDKATDGEEISADGREFFGLSNAAQSCLIAMNDSMKQSFSQIADALEAGKVADFMVKD